LGCFLQKARLGDRLSLATFNSGRLEVEIPPTGDFNALRQAMEQWQPYGTTAAHDAVAWLPDLETAGESWKHVAILVTDGVDNASALPASTARSLVRQAELPVYVIGLDTGSPFVLDLDGSKLYPFADVLNLLAFETGGRYSPIRWESEVPAACAAVVDDLRHQYVLSFPTRGDGKRVSHEIEVRVRGKRRHVAYRRGYIGGAPAPP
ncbi:MAG: VWA domain-containing protein, partial [Acidobacteria bacterium]|nr:VWA domain-containing protein [Acidobacteriota bacterium]